MSNWTYEVTGNASFNPAAGEVAGYTLRIKRDTDWMEEPVRIPQSCSDIRQYLEQAAIRMVGRFETGQLTLQYLRPLPVPEPNLDGTRVSHE